MKILIKIVKLYIYFYCNFRFMYKYYGGNTTIISMHTISTYVLHNSAILKHSGPGLIWKGGPGCLCRFFRRFLAPIFFFFWKKILYFFISTYNKLRYAHHIISIRTRLFKEIFLVCTFFFEIHLFFNFWKKKYSYFLFLLITSLDMHIILYQ